MNVLRLSRLLAQAIRHSSETAQPWRLAIDVLLTIPQAAAVLRVPEGWLRKKVTAGAVPHTRLGKHVRFSTDHLRQIVKAGESSPGASASVGSPHGVSLRARRGTNVGAATTTRAEARTFPRC